MGLILVKFAQTLFLDQNVKNRKSFCKMLEINIFFDQNPWFLSKGVMLVKLPPGNQSHSTIHYSEHFTSKILRSVQTGQRSNERERLKLHLFRTFPALTIRIKNDCKKVRNKGAFEKVCASFWYKLFFRVIRELNFDREPITASECLMDNHKIYQTHTRLKNSRN